ncbi:MAG: DHH family phosphoesterase, partial [Gammaproteobacteria bacterium]|nr:DHH family phosphoesterase [Gammaproteobacteria bacterium]
MNYQSSHRITRRESRPFPGQTPADLHPLLVQLLASRGVTRPEELEHGLGQLLPYQQLKGIESATTLLEQALRERWRLLIVGDFDADGATSTAVAVRALRQLGAAQVDFLVPNRFEYGYGLTPEIVAVAAQSKPDLIITVDNGIASVDGVAAAHQRGIRVLVTDHHLAPAELPVAEAIV